ncbi:transglycosylase family protein [Streptomyces niger]|uniref:transglycosylase family protein n=1 Tax=Streptomyces niger TaxID=66373 RepID=UPI00069BAA8D|nr:transglycosylase family protein [Streptomyces niger]
MRSGNGRHRRPRQAPALLVAASVTGAGMALPLLTAGGAQAADTATWDRVAMCESGGAWSANAGNGYYGGLQLTLQMWRDYGGESYAERPDLASRAQQIAVAESILNDRGPDAWPSCAVNAGLDVDGLIPDVDPGGSETPAPSESGDDASGGPSAGTGEGGDGADAGQPSGDATSKPSGDSSAPQADEPDTEPSGDPTAKPSDDPTSRPSDGGTDGTDTGAGADKGAGNADAGSDGDTAGPRAGDSADRPSGDASAPGTGRHRGTADDGKGEAGEGKDGRPAGRHASRGDAHRGTPSGGGVYTVRPGDSLSAIAEERGLAAGWTGLYDANEGVIGADPDLIHPGQRLELGQ